MTISPAPGAASARDWQLWLEDARRAAAAGLGAKQFTLSTGQRFRGLNRAVCGRPIAPALRASTLRWSPAEDPRRSGLSQLTSTFERFWYGGRQAAESDYRDGREPSRLG